MKIRNPRLTRLLAWCLGKSLRLLSRTVRYHLHEEFAGVSPISPDCRTPCLYALWHDQTLMPITFRIGISDPDKILPSRALVSKHQDGSWLTELMKHFHLGAIRGSSSKGGAAALRKLLETSEEGHIVITPDGPRGPRHKVKPGIVYLASATGIPIVVNANAVDRYWDIQGSWTNQIVPKPFSNVFLLTGAPIHVPPEITREQMEQYQTLLESELERLHVLAERIASGEISEIPPRDDRLDETIARAA
ncbi:MAG: lysophospholipid acyltransferase family protein [Planctomycetaceae bacterium]|nr:lysophospholipid acyltransferase family protein [Planctomycetaceae bacterium]